MRGVQKHGRLVNSANSVPLGGIAAFITIVGFAFFSGGYFPRSWGVGAALLAAVAAAANDPGITIGRLDRAYSLGIAAVLILTAISLSWTESVTLTMLELERTLVYAVFVGVAVIRCAVQPKLVWALVGATTAVASWAITEHLLLDRDIDQFQGALLTGSQKLRKRSCRDQRNGLYRRCGVQREWATVVDLGSRGAGAARGSRAER